MRTRAALLFVVSSLLFAATAAAAAPALVGRIAGASDAPISSTDRGVLRSRTVTVDGLVLAQAASDVRAGRGGASQLGIEFFPDRSFVISVQRVEELGNGATAYYGTVEGVPFSTAVIVQTGEAVSANVSAFGRLFQIRYRGAAGHEVRETDPSVFVDHSAEPIEVNAAPLAKSAAKVEVSGDDAPFIDVMVVWTPASRIAQGGVSAMQSLVNLAVAETNAAYTGSGVTQRLRLVYMGEVAHTEAASMATDLPRLASTSDGFMDQVHAIRNAYGADFVSLWGEYTDSCGIGYLMATESSGFTASAFNVVARTCATGNYSFGHELGHNMGLRHDNFVDSATTVIDAAATISTAHGYVDLPNRMRTIMAYNDQCAAQVPGFNCTRMQYFSAPAVSVASPFNSVVAPVGNASNANAASALNSTLNTTANFRTAVNLTGPGVVSFLIASQSVGEGAGTVSFTVSRLAGSAGAASVNWATVAGTALAGVHYANASGVLSWAAGDFSDKTVTVSILENALTEPDKAFTIALSAPSGVTLGPIPTAAIVLRDDEPDTWPVGACAIPAGFVNSTGSIAAWTTASDSTYQGSCALKSGQVPTANGTASGNNVSSIEYAGVVAAGTVSFKYRVSSYPSNGRMEFLVDGTIVHTNSGASGWTSFTSAALTAGSHTFTWRYVKTLTFNCATANPAPPEGPLCADRLWIDDVVIPVNFTLTVSKAGPGSGTVASSSPAGGIACGGDCSESYASGTVVTLTATPAVGSKFNGWSGACSGTGNCVVTMSLARSVTATFARFDVAFPDFNGDGKPDLLWSNTASGATYAWYMNGPVLISDAFVATIDPSWKVQGVADFNGDGKPDIVWRNTANGNTYVWYMNGPTLVSDAFLFSLPPEWVIQGVADFNGDGKPDFLMRNSVSGNAFAWFFNNATAIGDQFLFGIDPSWKVEGVGDLNGDGQPDLFFRNNVSGLAFAWFTQYSASTLSLGGSTPTLFSIDPAWEIVQVADWNGDGSPDFIFRNRDTGLVFVWYVNGTVLAGSDFIVAIDPSWEVVPRR